MSPLVLAILRMGNLYNGAADVGNIFAQISVPARNFNAFQIDPAVTADRSFIKTFLARIIDFA